MTRVPLNLRTNSSGVPTMKSLSNCLACSTVPWDMLGLKMLNKFRTEHRLTNFFTFEYKQTYLRTELEVPIMRIDQNNSPLRLDKLRYRTYGTVQMDCQFNLHVTEL